jgi:hypothetical protein
MKIIIYAFILSFMIGCNAEKACQRHINKAKAGGCLKMDSVIIYDTIKGFTHDTTVIFDTTHTQDTLTVIKHGIEVKTLIKWKERTISQIITKQDTIIKNVMVPIETIKKVEVIPWWIYLIGGSILLGWLLTLLAKLKK